MPELANKKSAIAPATDVLNLPQKMPRIPDEVVDRFPEMESYQAELDRWYTQIQTTLDETNQQTSTVVNQTYSATSDLVVTNGTLTAAITTEKNARIAADVALASLITTVSASVNAKIKVQGTAPLSPAVNDLWLDTSDQNKYKFWDGAVWQYKQDLVLAAAVTTESSARATADGNLSGKYTLTVAAGNVVTGMNITSSTGSGTNISDVTFVATNFKIYNSVTGVTMFNVSGTTVSLANTLVVSTAGRIYTGVGTYGNNNTPFYVDNASNFSLGAGLTWNGATLSINGNGSFSGTISAGAGNIGGFSIGSDYLLDAANSFGLASTITGGDDVRFWAGASFASRGSAPYRIYESGNLYASMGTIAGFTMSVAGFTAGAGSTYYNLDSTTGTLQVGTTSTTPGYSGDTSTGFSVEGGTSAIFVSRSNNFCGSFNRNNDGKLVLFGRSAVEVGSVQVTTTTTTYNTSSDRRIKFNIVPAGDLMALLHDVEIDQFEFIRDPGRKHLGWIAQKLYEIYPDAVSKGCDCKEVSDVWGVDYSKMVPPLWRIVQQMEKRLAALEA